MVEPKGHRHVGDDCPICIPEKNWPKLVTEPMTNAELAAMSGRQQEHNLKVYTISGSVGLHSALQIAHIDRGKLLTEVRRLRGEVTRLNLHRVEYTETMDKWTHELDERDNLRARLAVCESDLDAAQKEAARYFAGSQEWAKRAEAAEKALAILNGGK